MNNTPENLFLANLSVRLMNYYDRLTSQFFNEVAEKNISSRLSQSGEKLFLKIADLRREIRDEMPGVTNSISDGLAGKDYFPYEEIIITLGNLRQSGEAITEIIEEMQSSADSTEREILANYKNVFNNFTRRAGYAKDISRNMLSLSMVPDLPPLPASEIVEYDTAEEGNAPRG